MSWTEEGLSYAKARWKDRASASDISQELAQKFKIIVSRSAVCGKMYREGLSYRTPARTKPPKNSQEIHRTVVLRRNHSSLVKVTATFKELPKANDSVTAPHVAGMGWALLKNDCCRFILNDDPRYPLFCGIGEADFAGSKPFCKYHSRITYVSDIPHRRARNRTRIRTFNSY